MLSRQSYEGALEASQRDLLKPIANNTTSQLRMGDVFRTMDKVQSHDEETQGSGSSSGISDLSALENEATDDFGRQLLQHHRDQQRLNSAIRGNQQAFRKARPKPRVAEILDRQERERELQQIEDHQRVGSSGSNESDPPVTIPREWGRRARRQTDWMRKILEPSEPDENPKEPLKADEDAIYPRKTSYTGDLDWRDEANRPLQYVEDTPPSMRRQRRTTPPSSMRHMNTTLRPTNDFSEGDFNGASLLTSTPAATRLPRKIDELTRREIENVERQAVTTRALDQIDERSPNSAPNSALRRTSSSKLRERAIADPLSSPLPLARPITSPGKSTSPSRIPSRRRSYLGNKENLQPNGEVNGNANFKSSETVGLVDRTAQAVNVKTAQRPKHQRNDSMNLLKKLARVSSMSPSPARDKSEIDAMERKQEANSIRGARPSSMKSSNSSLDVNAEPPPKEVKQSVWGFGALLSKAQVNGQDTGNDLKQRTEHVSDDVDGTPMLQEPMAEPKTPVVTGGWIDTTLQIDALPQRDIAETDQQQPAPPAFGNDGANQDGHLPKDNLKRVQRKEANPKSALEAIIRETRTEQNDHHFGESTIQSLEDIVHPDLDPTDPTITFDFGAVDRQEQASNADRPPTQAQKDRRQEDLAIEGLNKHLRAARTSIKDASKGLRRVENRIETAQEVPKATRTTSMKSLTVTSNVETLDGVHCDTCGDAYKSVWHALWTEFRSCFYIYDHSGRFGVRLTWLGLACLLWVTWYILETLLCWHYSHRPFSCSVWDMGGGPMPPYVLPTVLFKPFKPLWEPWWDPLCKTLKQGSEAAFHAVFGDMVLDERLAFEMNAAPPRATVKKVVSSTIGYKHDWMTTATASATTASVRLAQSIVEAVDEVGSMWDDEFLT